MKSNTKQALKKIVAISFLSFLMFKIQAQSDIPCNAPFLTVNTDSCVYSTGTTVGSLYQNNVQNGGTPLCASPGSADVWYRLIVPMSGALSITTTQGTISDGGMAIYSGNCNNLFLISCNDDGAGNTMPVIDRSDFIPGDTLYLRFWNAWSIYNGTFNICAIESHSDCRSATFICNERHLARNAYGPGSNFDAFSSNNCGITEFQSQWLTFNFLNSGTFSFTLFPDSLQSGFYPDYDWMIFKSPNPFYCSTYDSSLAPIVCNASNSIGIFGSTGLDNSGTSNSVPPGPGNPFCPLLYVNAGEFYYLFLNNYSITSTGYRLVFGGTASMNCNQSTSLEIPMNEYQLKVYSNPATEFIIIESSINAEIEIINSEGQIIRKFKVMDRKTKIDISNLNEGIYILKSASKNQVEIKKFLKI